MEDRWPIIEELFFRAIELEPDERAAFVERECAGDEEVRREVASLLEAHENGETFLERPAADMPVSLANTLFRTAQQAPAGQTASDLPTGVLGPADADVAPGTIVDGKYRVEAAVGRGGMGAVFRATQLNLHRSVAIKVMRSETSRAREALDRFRREALAIARLRHPHIVSIHDIGVSADVGAYIVMEFLDGESLAETLKREKRLPPSQAVGLMLQICSAVYGAHEAGVLHRDLKPANVVVEPTTAGPWAKVLDFGIAELQGADLLADGSLSASMADFVIGTPHYMSPEQCQGDPVDARADVYALGCMLFELLVGIPPFGFTTGNVVEILRRQRKEPPPAPSAHAPRIPPSLDRIVLRSLAKDREERFATAAELGEALAGLVLDTPNNLPVSPTVFVGRDQEVADVLRLAGATRLLTLVGSAGIGKTRLALEVAAQSAERFPDGVWLVELAPISDASLVPQAVARALSVKEMPGRPLLETLREAVRTRRTMLVLDNCEHVVEAVARLVADLLRASAGLRVLTTSREALDVPGETVWHVPAMSLPDDAVAESPEELLRFEAVRLFADRARASRPEFAVTRANARAVRELCRRLEGIPLAIELAAARARLLSIDQILEKMEDRFRLLTGGARTSIERQRTLEAAIAWSYDLLSEPERSVLDALSVFVGGWTVEAAQAVVGDAGPATPDLVERLADKSLVVVTPHVSGTRYAMLESIRQFAARKLDASGAREPMLARHRDWYLRFVEPADDVLLGPEAREWSARYEAEHPNLRAILRRARDARDAETSQRLANALAYYWRAHGYLSEGRRWLEDALARGADLPAELRAKGLNGVGVLAYYQGELETALQYLEASVALYRELGERERTARMLYNLGAITNGLGHYDRAVELYEESIRLFRDLQNDAGAGRAVNGLGLVALDRGDFAAAERYFEELRETSSAADDLRGVAGALHNLGVVARRSGRIDDAERLFDEGVSLARDLDDRQLIASSVFSLGTVALDRGDLVTAVARFGRALALQRELGAKDGIVDALEGFACAAGAGGEPEPAARLFGAASALRDELHLMLHPSERACLDPHIARVRETLGDERAAELIEHGRGEPLDAVVDEALARAARI